LGIASNVITSYKQQNLDGKSKAPVTINCLTGAERSGIAILAITAILATQSKRPVLISN
jgi:tyrosine-protein phosphatase non-receptor type 23